MSSCSGCIGGRVSISVVRESSCCIFKSGGSFCWQQVWWIISFGFNLSVSELNWCGNRGLPDSIRILISISLIRSLLPLLLAPMKQIFTSLSADFSRACAFCSLQSPAIRRRPHWVFEFNRLLICCAEIVREITTHEHRLIRVRG